jgi:hypothetical protein
MAIRTIRRKRSKEAVMNRDFFLRVSSCHRMCAEMHKKEAVATDGRSPTGIVGASKVEILL